MNYYVLTLFPEMIRETLRHGIIGKAQENGLISLNTINIRDFASNKYKQVDDYPYGGGAGMVMQPMPIEAAYNSLPDKVKGKLIYLSPQGKPFNQDMARQLAREESLVFLCGHYEGVDERIIESLVTEEVSIGDYILTGGELAVMVLIDAIARLVPGVLGNEASPDVESFDDGLLEYPQYTRPFDYKGMTVPEVLISGHHKNIDAWRRQQALIRTIHKRPDLLKAARLTEEDKLFIENYCKENKIVL